MQGSDLLSWTIPDTHSFSLHITHYLSLTLNFSYMCRCCEHCLCLHGCLHLGQVCNKALCTSCIKRLWVCQNVFYLKVSLHGAVIQQYTCMKYILSARSIQFALQTKTNLVGHQSMVNIWTTVIDFDLTGFIVFLTNSFQVIEFQIAWKTLFRSMHRCHGKLLLVS